MIQKRVNKRLSSVIHKSRRAGSFATQLKPIELLSVSKQYRANRHAILLQKRAEATKLAVVVHLYYPESWSLFSEALKKLNHGFDLFITLPKQNIAFAKTIQNDYQNARIIEVPNRGRDVLPFIRVASLLQQLGYTYVLKLHSKKSTHRTDGNEWLKIMVNDLLPSDGKVLHKLVEILSKSDTGVIGPANQYIPLTVNFEANGIHMTRILRRIYSANMSYDVLQNHRVDYGFFAGTMFWVRLDAIKPILDQLFRGANFESEKGQIDATFAHALERVFCLVPEIEKRKMYEVSSAAVTPISYKTENVPDWSDVYIGPKAR